MLLVLESFPPPPVFKAASREPSCGCPGSFPLSSHSPTSASLKHSLYHLSLYQPHQLLPPAACFLWALLRVPTAKLLPLP